MRVFGLTPIRCVYPKHASNDDDHTVFLGVYLYNLIYMTATLVDWQGATNNQEEGLGNKEMRHQCNVS